jgi:hypothetical protein
VVKWLGEAVKAETMFVNIESVARLGSREESIKF